jgi:catechol 2,3-dioxygenase-like lactoylglutathione lyase family enzyme
MFQVDSIDHIELFVPDRRAAAHWYERTLGLAIVPRFEHWAEDPQGPLMISPDEGRTKLALFTGEPQGRRTTAGFHLVAFHVDGMGFFRFLEHVGHAPVFDEAGEEVRILAPRDHGAAFSVYFRDPWGHRLEVTTYDAEYVRERL